MIRPTTSDPNRSALMKRVRQRGTTAERAVAACFRSLGVSYRLNVRKLPGSPDFANCTKRWAVFVNGCFWHHHTGCRRASIPKSNTAFWTGKFADNRARDLRAINALRQSHFRVLIIWECEAVESERLRARLLKFLTNSNRAQLA
jgi:DNA mismatch endonuclease (patch repair protein)